MARGTKTAARTQLTRESIVERALEIAQRDGPSALTLRKLGTELGVDGTAFYRHFPDKDSIVLAVGDHVTGLIYDEVMATTTTDDPWQTRIRTLARAGWEASNRYPGVLALTFARTTGEAAERSIVEMLLGIIEPLGLGPERTVLVYRMFGDAILAVTGMNGHVQSLEAPLREKDATAWSRIYAVLPHQEYPATRRHRSELIDVQDREIFEFTIDTLIRGVEALLAEA